MVARDTERHTAGDHAHHQLQHFGDARAAVHEVADEYGLPALRMACRKAGLPVSAGAGLQSVAEAFEEDDQFVVAPMHVTDDVEWPMFML